MEWIKESFFVKNLFLQPFPKTAGIIVENKRKRGIKPMKKLIIAILVALLTFSVFGCKSNDVPAPSGNDTPDVKEPEANADAKESENVGDAPVAGGWQIPDSDMKAAAEEAFKKATEGRVGYTYEMIECISYQIVAGVNYKIICRGKAVSPEASSEILLITVWSKVDGTAEITDSIELIAAAGKGLLGGWTVNEGSLNVADNETAKAAFEKAMEQLVGANHEPIALLASQVVAGTNYQFLCKTTPVVLNPQPHYTFVKIYAALDGHAEILEIVDAEDYQPEDFTLAPEESPVEDPDEFPGKAPGEPDPGEVVGGWIHMTDDVLPYAEAAFEQATEKKLGYTYELLACTSYQVVSGMNYQYICRGKSIGAKSEPEIILVTVYAPLTDPAEITDVQYIIEAPDEPLDGGWGAYAGSLSLDQNPEAKAAFDQAIGEIVGATYEPVALLGSQIVAGTNYMILCRTTAVYPNATPYYTIVNLFVDLDGNAKIVNIMDL